MSPQSLPAAACCPQNCRYVLPAHLFCVSTTWSSYCSCLVAAPPVRSLTSSTQDPVQIIYRGAHRTGELRKSLTCVSLEGFELAILKFLNPPYTLQRHGDPRADDPPRDVPWLWRSVADLSQETRVQSQARPCEICTQSGTWTSLPPSTSVLTYQCHSTNALYSLIHLSPTR